MSRGPAGKGSRLETLAKKVLESQGYVVHRSTKSGGWRGNRYISNSNDVFACDLIGKTPSKTIWAQVTASSNLATRVAKLNAVPWCETDDVVILRWKGGHGGQYFHVHPRSAGYKVDHTRRMHVTPQETKP